MVSPNLCQEYLILATFRILILLLIKSSTFWYTDRLLTSSHTGVMYFQKWSGFLAHPVHLYSPKMVASIDKKNIHTYIIYCSGSGGELWASERGPGRSHKGICYISAYEMCLKLFVDDVREGLCLFHDPSWPLSTSASASYFYISIHIQYTEEIDFAYVDGGLLRDS